MNANMYYGNNTHNALIEQNSPNPNDVNSPLPVTPVGYSDYNTGNTGNTGNNYNTTNQPCNYPATGLTVHDADRGDTRTEFILPENLKVGLIMLAICCLLTFFIILIVK